MWRRGVKPGVWWSRWCRQLTKMGDPWVAPTNTIGEIKRKLSTVVDSVFPLAQIATGFAHVESGA